MRTLITYVLIVCLAFSANPINAEPDPPVLVEAACVICGTVIVAGGCWMGWKLYKTAKNKLYPPPVVPGVTNAPPSPSGYSADHHIADVLSDGIIYNIDMSQMTPDDMAKDVMPDGLRATTYAVATLKGSADMQTWTASAPIEIWLSGTYYVVRYGSYTDGGRNSITNTTTGEMSMRPVIVDKEQPVSAARFFKM